MEKNDFNPNSCVCHLEGAAMFLTFLVSNNVQGFTKANEADYMVKFIRESAHVCCDRKDEKNGNEIAKRVQNLKDVYSRMEENMRFYRGESKYEVYRIIVNALRQFLGLK